MRLPGKRLKFEGKTSRETENGFGAGKWALRESRLVDWRENLLHFQRDIEAPIGWSDQAVNIVVRQYLRKRLPDGTSETSIQVLISRVVQAIRDFGENTISAFASKEDAAAFEGTLTNLVVDQRASFNSPVWFNCGLWFRYKISGNSGNWAWDFDTKKAVPIANAFERPQSSACFIQSLEDDLNSIFELVKNEARLFKYGSGTGTNFSCLRSNKEATAGGGMSSGLMSFLEVFDRAAGATKSGGTTRRAAKMVCLDLDHPEIMNFIRWKAKEESKAQALLNAGFSGGMDGEAYHTVSGQNSNNSVRINDEFMHAVKSSGFWSTKSRLTGATIETYKASTIFRAIADAAWACADPGVQFEDAIQKWHTCRTTGPIRASNPCSEFMFLDDTACNLASINLIKFIDRTGHFDIKAFCSAVRTLIIAQEFLVDFASYPSAAIAENSHRFRPIGLGFANLGGTLMALGIPYDSELARRWAASVTALMTGEAYRVSAELAEVFGAFDGFAKNRESMFDVIEMHMAALDSIKADAARSGSEGLLANDIDHIFLAAENSWTAAQKHAAVVGFRNAQVTVLAPTGTIAFMMDCDTTGIEPEYALVKLKFLADGGQLRVVNRTIGRALQILGYEQSSIENIVAKIGLGEDVMSAGVRAEHVDVFACAQEISPEAHLLMMSAVQPFLSGAISKTVNLPETATVEEVEAIFMRGWELGLKAVAVYRDGSKAVQPLRQLQVGNLSVQAPTQSAKNQNLCPECSHPTLMSGTCWVCPNCGHSIACS